MYKMKLNTRCDLSRRFGVEIELNTTTGIIKSKEYVPDGGEEVARLIRRVVTEPVELHGWHYTNNNNCWVIKPDGSCGIEVCSPILKGAVDLAKLVKIVQHFRDDPRIQSDRRCSFHVHVNVEDLSNYQIASVLASWIKCEGVLYDSLPGYRKCSRHAQLIGMSNLVDHVDTPVVERLIEILSYTKYHSASTYHLRKGRRRSIEFRIAENSFCTNPLAVKNWIRFLLHFIACTKDRKLPKRYRPNDPWSGLVWLDLLRVWVLLGFNSKQLSPGLNQVRHWFLQRLLQNTCQTSLGIWEEGMRDHTWQQLQKLVSKVSRQTEANEATLLYSKELMT